MRVIAPLLALGLLAVAVVVYCIASGHLCGTYAHCGLLDQFPTFYGEKLRASLFAGFLTLGGFLMSLKTFIVVNMKKEVYENPAYREEWSDNNARAKEVGSAEIALYAPLKELSSVLFLAIASSITASILQLTIGLVPNLYATIFCLYSAAFAVAMVVYALVLIRLNLLRMFRYLEMPKP